MRSRSIIKSTIWLAALPIFAAVRFAAGQAASSQPLPPPTVKNPSPYLVDLSNLGDLVFRIVDWLLYISAALAVVFLVVGGFQYIAARGNEEATEKAKKTITGAVIGLIVVILAFAIVTIIDSALRRKPSEITAFTVSSAYEI